jgi:UDP-2,3-diacylglucosamine pyrophosphatase LpxH
VPGVRTLLVSDLHLGQRPGHDVLRRPDVLERLLDALDGVDRLVLLGDVVELAYRRHRRDPLTAAAPILQAIGARMGASREIVIVPGNHDGTMVREWALRRGPELGVSDAVPRDATPALEAVTDLLGPAAVRASYPGFWVREDVWGTHGHYLDRHLIPESTFGLPRGRLARRDPPHRASALAIDYELPRRGRRAGPEGLLGDVLERPLAVVLEHLAELTRYGSRVLRHVDLTRITARALDLQVRRAAVPAIVEAAARLGVDARSIVFGHVHRAGPVDGRPAPARGHSDWMPAPGGPRVYNTGSWVYEPLLLDGGGPPHPYWPGGAVLVEDGLEPRVLALLDGLDGDALTGPDGGR